MNMEPNLDAFARVANAYDIPHLSQCRIVVVGVGGARQFVEDMARAGIGQFVLIDGDVISGANIGTQHVYADEVGWKKVHCVGGGIKRINATALTLCYDGHLDDCVDDQTVETWLKGRLFLDDGSVLPEPAVTLICGFTDSFAAQARVNRIALQFSVPSLSAQLYREGRGLELTFTHPDYTEACHRCILASRYKHFSSGYVNEVGSGGTPIFATGRINALKGLVAMALLHAPTKHRRWNALLERMKNRNLVQVRFDPDIEAELGIKVFERALAGADQSRILCDETVWLNQKADHPSIGRTICPDCLGVGDLRDCAGTFADTRYMVHYD